MILKNIIKMTYNQIMIYMQDKQVNLHLFTPWRVQHDKGKFYVLQYR